MMLLDAVQASTKVLAHLLNPAVRALLLSLIVGVGLAGFRVRTASLRLFTWTAVLYAAMAMPMLQWMLPPLPIPAPAVLENAFPQHPDSAPSGLRMDGVFLGGRHAAQSVPTDVVVMQAIATPATGDRSVRHQKAQKPKLAPASGNATSRTDTPATPAAAAPPSFRSGIPWNALAAAIYFAVASLLLVRFFVGLLFSRRLLRASQEIDEPRLTLKLASRARTVKLSSILRAAESELISVPLTMGALRSIILLPADWREWDDAKLDAVLAHELSHVVRHDALTQRLSLLHRAIFWFSPLAWWLDRHLADLAEQASDEAALSGGADRKDYARTLLEFFELLQSAPRRVWWQGVAMAKAGQAERQAEERFERILSWKGPVTSGMKNMGIRNIALQKSIAVVVLTLAISVVYLAASAHPASAYVRLQGAELAPAQTPPPAPRPAAKTQSADTLAPALAPASDAPPTFEPSAQSEVVPTPEAPDETINGTNREGGSRMPAPAVAPPPPVAGPVYPPNAATAPVASVASVASATGSSQSSNRGFSYHYGYDDEQRFVIVSGKTDSLTMSGSVEDARHVEKLRKLIPGDFIWFQSDEKSYVIRDQATIDRAKKLWDPQEELGKQQEALGKQQEALGKQQEAIGAKMQQVKVNVPDMTADLEKLKAELKQLSSGATVEQVGHIQSEIGELQSKIGEIQSHAGVQQSKLGEEMSALGEQQGRLGEQQGELGRQQGERAREATRQMKQLLDEAVTKGIAQPEL
jgi:beta-lactamase regulating signal transducer with metallopeptidase domain